VRTQKLGQPPAIQCLLVISLSLPRAFTLFFIASFVNPGCSVVLILHVTAVRLSNSLRLDYKAGLDRPSFDSTATSSRMVETE